MYQRSGAKKCEGELCKKKLGKVDQPLPKEAIFV
jgi:hypothetical protein